MFSFWVFYIYIFILFSKAKSISIKGSNPWCFTVTARDPQATPLTEDVSLRPDSVGATSTLPELLGDVVIPKKYPAGKHLNIQQDKVTDLKTLRNYLTEPGQKWAEDVIKGQETAGMIDIFNSIWFVYFVFIVTVNNIILLWIY